MMYCRTCQTRISQSQKPFKNSRFCNQKCRVAHWAKVFGNNYIRHRDESTARVLNDYLKDLKLHPRQKKVMLVTPPLPPRGWSVQARE